MDLTEAQKEEILLLLQDKNSSAVNSVGAPSSVIPLQENLEDCCPQVIDESELTEGLSDKVKLPPKEHREMLLKMKVGHFGIINKNKRYYPKDIGEREVKALNEKIQKSGGVFSNDQHPTKSRDGTVINPPTWGTTAFIPFSLEMNESGEVFSFGVVPKTTSGSNLAAVIRAGGRPGASTRGNGTVIKKRVQLKEGGIEEIAVVKDDFKLKTYDIVIDQSVSDAGIIELSESTPEQDVTDKPVVSSEEMVESKTSVVHDMKKLTDWLKENKDAGEKLISVLEGATSEEVKSQFPSLFEGIQGIVSKELEEKVSGEFRSEFESFCEGVRQEIKESEMEEAQASAIAEFLEKAGISHELAEALLENEGLGQTLEEGLLDALQEEQQEEAQRQDGGDPGEGEEGEGEGAEQNEALKNINESVEELRKELAKSKIETRIAELSSAFAYGSKVFNKIKPLLNEAATVDEVNAIYEAQVDLLKAADVPETKRKLGQSQFLPEDSVEQLQENNRSSGQDLDESQLNDAASSFEAVPAAEVR